MSIVVGTNILSLDAQRNLGINQRGFNTALERLSSGSRLNHAADDAAGFQISAKLDGQVRGIQQSISNSQDGISVLRIAEGAYNTAQDNLLRVRELTVQAANDTLSSTQRTTIENEIKSRLNENDRVAKQTEFNGLKLTDGSLTTFKLQVGQNTKASQDVINAGAAFTNIKASALGVSAAGVDVSTNSKANAFLAKVDTAIDTLTTARASLGSFENRLNSAIDTQNIALTNFTSSLSRIRDTDVAKEAANVTKYQILLQANSSTLSQANQSPQLALSLLR